MRALAQHTPRADNAAADAAANLALDTGSFRNVQVSEIASLLKGLSNQSGTAEHV